MSLLTKLAVGAIAVAAIVKSKVLEAPAAKARRGVVAKAKKTVKAIKPAARSTAKKARRAASAARKATTRRKTA